MKNLFIRRNNKELRNFLDSNGYKCYGKDSNVKTHTCIYVHNTGIYYLTNRMPSRSEAIVNCEKDTKKFITIIQIDQLNTVWQQ